MDSQTSPAIDAGDPAENIDNETPDPDNVRINLGAYGGTITRISDHPVINVSAGGGLVPTFTAEQKKAG